MQASSSFITRAPFESGGVKIQEEIQGTSIYDTFGLKYFLSKASFRRPPKEGNRTYTAVSAYLSNTTAKWRDVAKQLLGQLGKVAVENNDADIIAGDFNSSAYRDRRKVGVSSIEETWEKTLLIPPPDVVPMRGQMEESEDCCGFTLTKKSEPSWRVARHGSIQFNNDKMQIEETDQAAHLPCLHTPLRSTDSPEKHSL